MQIIAIDNNNDPDNRDIGSINQFQQFYKHHPINRTIEIINHDRRQ